jgi:ATP-binding cassette, subfamily C, bacterial CydC
MRAIIATWLRRADVTPTQLVISGAIALVSSLMGFGLIVGSGVLLARAAGVRSLASLAGLLIVIELVAFLRSPMRFEERIAGHRRAVYATARLRLWLFDLIAQRIPGSLSMVASGQLLDSAIEDLETLEGLYVSTITPLLSGLSSMLIAVIATVILDPLIGLVTLGAAVLLLAIIASLLKPLSTAAREEKHARSGASLAAADLFVGLVELTMAGRQEETIRVIEQREHQRSLTTQRTSFLVATVTATTGVVIAAVMGLVIRIAANGHHLSGVGKVAVVLLVLAGLEGLLAALPATISLASVSVASERLSLICDAPLAPVVTTAELAWPEDQASIDVSQLSVGAGESDVIQGATFRIPPHALTLITGPSGAGKSTLVSCIMGLITPSSGTISIAGTDLSQVPLAIRWQHISLVDQHPLLFGTTLGEALRVANAIAGDDDLFRVLQLVGLGDIANSQGLSMPTGEGGAAFSGGELRRIAIARSLVRNPDILILDEPTVGLDPTQAEALLATVKELSEHITVIMISHDTNLATDADAVLWLDDGDVRVVTG